jgi:hypothetical protein
VADAVLQWVLVSNSVGLISSVAAMARERGRQSVAHVLAEMAQSDEFGTLSAFAPERLATTTRSFLDLILMPLLLRALLGEELKSLHAEIGPHVARSVTFFLAAARHGGVD